MTATLHGLVSPEERMLSAIEARQEIERLEAAYDVMPPGVRQRVRDLAAGRVTVPVPSASQQIAELVRLRDISRDQWAGLKRCVVALRQARAAHRLDGTIAAWADAKWQLNFWQATRRTIARIEAEIATMASGQDRGLGG